MLFLIIISLVILTICLLEFKYYYKENLKFKMYIDRKILLFIADISYIFIRIFFCKSKKDLITNKHDNKKLKLIFKKFYGDISEAEYDTEIKNLDIDLKNYERKLKLKNIDKNQ